MIVDVDVATRAGHQPRDLARAFLNGGARLLQLRGKTLESGVFLDLAVAIQEDVAAAGAALIVNDRADIAAIAATAGVHVGQEDLSPRDVRRVVGDRTIVGLSTHSQAQIEAALAEPITYLAVGPVFGTTTKKTGYASIGLSVVADASRRAAAQRLPVVAIGGITLESARSIIEAGAASVAVITDLLKGAPEARVRQYLSVLG